MPIRFPGQAAPNEGSPGNQRGGSGFRGIVASLVRIGDPAGAYIEVDNQGIRFHNGEAAQTISLGTDGDVFIGSDISSPATTYIAIFSTNQTYNGEAMTAGDMLIGDNSSGQANLLWDKSTGTLRGRSGTINTLNIDSDGGLEIYVNYNVSLGDLSERNAITFLSPDDETVFGIYPNMSVVSPTEGEIRLWMVSDGEDINQFRKSLTTSLVSSVSSTWALHLEGELGTAELNVSAGTTAVAELFLDGAGAYFQVNAPIRYVGPSDDGVFTDVYFKYPHLILRGRDGAGVYRYKYIDMFDPTPSWLDSATEP